jgi:hypothetical protein
LPSIASPSYNPDIFTFSRKSCECDATSLNKQPAQGANTLSSTIDAPLEWVEAVGNLRLPPKANQRLQDLMDRNNDGLLTEAELTDLESLVELSERLSLVRAEALHLLGRKPE